MKAIIFDTDTSKLNLNREIQLLKLSYLFADSLIAGGQVAANIMFEKEQKKYSFKKKLLFILSQISNRENEDAKKQTAQLLDFIALDKKVQKLKHIPNQVFVSLKRSSGIYINWFSGMAIELAESHQKLGISAMYSWFEDKVLEFSVSGLCVGEERRKKDTEKNVTELLALLFQSNSNDSILVFPSDLIGNNYLTPSEKEDLVEKEGMPLKGVNIYDCFKVQSIASLTSLELKALRGQLNESFIEFRRKVEDWILYCKQNDEINSQVKRLKEDVLPCTIAIDEILQKNQMLNCFENNAKLDTLDFMVYLGIAPVKSILKYYEEFKVLDIDMLTLMRATIAQSNDYPKFLPIVCILSDYRFLEKMEELMEIEKLENLDPTRKKKSILVD